MDLENQVCSLELAKKLKKIGVKQESIFYWIKPQIPQDLYSDQIKIKDLEEYFIISKYDERKIYIEDFFDGLKLQSYGCGCCYWDMELKEIYSAFTASELLNILPTGTDVIKQNDNFSVFFFRVNTFIHITQDINLSNALSEMLIYLIDNKLIFGI